MIASAQCLANLDLIAWAMDFGQSNGFTDVMTANGPFRILSGTLKYVMSPSASSSGVGTFDAGGGLNGAVAVKADASTSTVLSLKNSRNSFTTCASLAVSGHDHLFMSIRSLPLALKAVWTLFIGWACGLDPDVDGGSCLLVIARSLRASPIFVLQSSGGAWP